MHDSVLGVPLDKVGRYHMGVLESADHCDLNVAVATLEHNEFALDAVGAFHAQVRLRRSSSLTNHRGAWSNALAVGTTHHETD
jgi:hypothetical protein